MYVGYDLLLGFIVGQNTDTWRKLTVAGSRRQRTQIPYR